MSGISFNLDISHFTVANAAAGVGKLFATKTLRVYKKIANIRITKKPDTLREIDTS